MDIFEISGFRTGVDKGGVNFLDPADAFETLENGYIYRQELLSRKGFTQFANRLDDESRVMGIFENVTVNSTRQLLVCSQDYLYVYNSGTNEFDQIPFAGSAAAFGISNPEDYVSGTTYFDTNGTIATNRFVFTGKGMSDIYFYDGTNVQSYTQDNANYQAPADGALTNAKHIMWFGERLVLFVPTISGQSNPQGVLYSAIRNLAGDGDKFNSPGAGLLEADTYEVMKAVDTLGDIVIMKFQRSDWSLEKTRDAFNPFFVRKIPSVLGTDADFSSASWSYEVKSVGKTGLITTDGRQSLRFDDKLPYYTADDIDQENFELTYAGFDRINTQFLFSHRSNGSELSSITQDKVLVYNYKESTWSINDQRFSVFGQSDAGQNLTWDDIDETNQNSWAEWDTTEEAWDKIGLGEVTQKTLAGDNLGFVYEINKGNDDYFAEISAITKATSAIITVEESAFQIGDEVYIDSVEGMTQINGLTGTISAASTTSITVNINSSVFDTYTTGGTVSKVIDFKAKTTVFNPYRAQGYRCSISHLEFLVTANRGSFYVDIYENTNVPDNDNGESAFKSVLIDTNVYDDDGELNNNILTKWVTVIVNDQANFFVFVMRAKSVANQKSISAIRIHASPGGLTAG